MPPTPSYLISHTLKHFHAHSHSFNHGSLAGSDSSALGNDMVQPDLLWYLRLSAPPSVTVRPCILVDEAEWCAILANIVTSDVVQANSYLDMAAVGPYERTGCEPCVKATVTILLIA